MSDFNLNQFVLAHQNRVTFDFGLWTWTLTWIVTIIQFILENYLLSNPTQLEQHLYVVFTRLTFGWTLLAHHRESIEETCCVLFMSLTQSGYGRSMCFTCINSQSKIWIWFAQWESDILCIRDGSEVRLIKTVWLVFIWKLTKMYI